MKHVPPRDNTVVVAKTKHVAGEVDGPDGQAGTGESETHKPVQQQAGTGESETPRGKQAGTVEEAVGGSQKP
eukprot:2377496-Prorocentrum_lima.AAC.1